MVVLNYTGEEINAKIVYYGPGLSGKTTNLEYLYSQMPADSKGQMVSMKTRTDRTLFFDFFPLELGEICGYRTRFLLYTVPGQVYYNATRKLVLKGADAVVFVADSARDKLQENIESLRNLEDNLNEHGLSLDNVPWIIQYNKRDLPDPMAVDELHQHLNLMNVPAFEAIALNGFGVYETFKSIAGILYKQLKQRLENGEVIVSSDEPATQGMPAPGARGPADVTDALDTALREVDVGAGPGGLTKDAGVVEEHKPRTAVPPAPPHPQGVKPPQPQQATPVASIPRVTRPNDSPPVTREAPAAAPVEPPRQSVTPSPANAAAPPRPTAAGPNGDSFSFQTEDEALSPDVGRLIELDESSDRPESTQTEEPTEFITDPMRSSPPMESAPGIEADEAPVVRERKVEAQETELMVPVVISRSQVRKTIPLRLRLEIRVVDD